MSTFGTADESDSPALQSAMEEVHRWSSTFYPIIQHSPTDLRAAKASFYLLFRGIDEIEDHPDLPTTVKVRLLTDVAAALQTRNVAGYLQEAFAEYQAVLPGVTLRLGEWAALAPAAIGARIIDAASAMASRMAFWCDRAWRIDTVDDFDHYLFSVAGTPGMLLCDIWAWHEGTRISRSGGMSLARGMQAANILADQAVDRERGVSFLPPAWTQDDLVDYTNRELSAAAEMVATLPMDSQAYAWCSHLIAVSQQRVTAART